MSIEDTPDKQELFCLHYASTLNATQAAIQAGYSAKTAYSQGQRLLKNVEIKKRISALLKEQTIDATEVLGRLSSMATCDIGDFYNEQGELDLMAAKRKGLTHLIKKIKYAKDGSFIESIELHDPQSALVHLGKAYQLFTDKLELSGKVDSDIQLIPMGHLTFEQLLELKQAGK